LLAASARPDFDDDVFNKPGFSGCSDWVVELVGLEPNHQVLWNIVVSDHTPLVGHPSKSAGEEQSDLARRGGACPTRVLGRTRTMFHNALVVDEVSESQENQAKQQNARRSG